MQQAIGFLTLFLTCLSSLSQAQASTQEEAPKRWIVVLKNSQQGYQAQELGVSQKLQRIQRVIPKKKSWSLPRTQVLIAENLDNEEILKISSQEDVAYIERDVRWKTFDAGPSNELPSSQTQSPWLKDVLGLSANEANPYIENTYKTSLKVAVIDTGSNVEHPFLKPALHTNKAEANGRPGVDDDNNGFVDDIHGINAISRSGSGSETSTSHGTHVAGIVKTIRDQAIALYPQAAQVEIIPIRFMDESGGGSTAHAIASLEYAAAQGARVINASWGAKGMESYSQALYDTLARLYQKNILIVVAAGNAEMAGPNNNDAIPFFPANYNIPGLISVASVSPYYNSSWSSPGSYRLVSQSLSYFSNYGEQSVHLAAPGDYIDGRGGSPGILSANSQFESWGTLYKKMQGTSMAAPVIAGIAGVMMALNPKLSAYETRQLLISSAKKHSQLGNIQSQAIVHAASAFEAAREFNAKGTQLVLPSETVTGTRAYASGKTQVPGCGSIRAIGSSASGNGPLGGNSLGLLALGYAIWSLVKRRPMQKGASSV